MMKILLAFILILALFFIVVMVIDCNRFVIREYRCEDKMLKKPLKIVQLSDLHNKSFGKDNSRLIHAIREQNPDLIIVSGDMYTSLPGKETIAAQKLMEELAKSYSVYYANGNHEQKTREETEEFGSLYEDYRKKLSGIGIHFLSNEHVYLKDYNISLYGLEIHRRYYRKFRKQILGADRVQEYLGVPDPGSFHMMIAHNPDFFEDYAAWGADLVFAGHVHGGLMRLPVLGGVIAPSMKLFPKYDGGEFHEGNAAMILSRGLGTHTLPIRIFNPGELVVVKLTP